MSPMSKSRHFLPPSLQDLVLAIHLLLSRHMTMVFMHSMGDGLQGQAL